MLIRRYNPESDMKNVLRIFREIGWWPCNKERNFEQFMQATRGFVAELNGVAECSVRTHAGSLCYLDSELPFAGVGSVATSQIARHRGLASRTTAVALADAAQCGAVVAGLHMFEQGYYNQLGFGTMPYNNLVTFDPATLMVSNKPSIPQRLSLNDVELLHQNRLNRLRPHGGIILNRTEATMSMIVESENGFGLGYSDGKRISHHFWAEAKRGNRQYHVEWLAYENTKQLMELLSLLHNVSDQVQHVTMQEPPQIQIQDLLDQPLRNRAQTYRTENEQLIESRAVAQIRILNLPACIIALKAREKIEFNLKIRDPLAQFLPEDGWNGVSGEYIIRIGEISSAELGYDSQLPTLSSDIGAFSRILFGVRSASSIALTDDVNGPSELLHGLDKAILLPTPNFDWDF